MAVGPAAAPTVLVLRALGLGDLLTAVPALRALADAYPDHRRVLAAPGWLAGLAALTDAVDEVVHTDLRTAGPAGDLPPLDLPAPRPAVAVNLHGRGPASHRILLATRPQRMVGFRHPRVPESAHGPEWRDDEHEVARWCRLLFAHGIPADPGRLALDVPVDAAPPTAVGATLLHPGAASPARRWPPARWVAVARAERGAGRRVVVTGGPGEVAVAGRIAADAGLPPHAVLAGRTDPVTLAAVVAVAARVVCGDTGVAHLATAAGTPSVVLFGPTPPSLWGPPPSPRHRALWAGRRGDPHARTPHPGLLALSVADVLAELAALPPPEPAQTPARPTAERVSG